jgi:hypothetical protein
MTFTAFNAVEQMILDAAAKLGVKHWNAWLSEFAL